MTFRAAFIGINKHADPGITELTGAVRDAQALSALFSDTFEGINLHLLLDEQGTLAAIRDALESVLGDATADDVVVLSFAGHGTPGHQLVTYDTQPNALPHTSLPMQELAERFQATKARAVLCIVDACFSGATPARVLDGVPIPRNGMFDYSAFKGKGKFLLAAASPTQSAWEEPGSGHGLLTRAVIDVLTEGSGSIDIIAAVARIMTQTRALAQAIGEQQDPCFVGGVEGELIVPVLKRANAWQTLFPDLTTAIVSHVIADLTAFGVPTEILDQWQIRFENGLNALQLEAVNRCRVLNGESLLTIAPTSSGKTFIGELAAIRAALSGQKSVFLLPYRALVNEKYEDFAALYGPVGLRVIRCSGDFTDETGLFLSGRYDVAILTFEMFLGLAVSAPHVLKHLGTAILDEAQFIADPGRGISVELLLTLILAARDRGVRPQLVVLSAVIGNANGFDEWLGCRMLNSTRRPVPLSEGVLDRFGIYQMLDPDGNETEQQLIPRTAIRQRRKEPSAQDVIVPLAQKLVEENEKVLIFRNRRGPAEGCAGYLADELGLPAADGALASLSQHDLSSSATHLRKCLTGGTAFHNANLTREERVVVERSFRNPNGGISALAATTTLAAGINTPASTVILAEQEFIGEDGRPFTVAEYKNMAGRAGRLGFNETGKSIILAETPMQRRQLFLKYVRGAPEPITSSFSDADLRTWIVRLLSQVRELSEADVPHLLARTYGGFLASKSDPQWSARSEAQIAEIIAQFVQLGLLERYEAKVQLTLLGRACGQSSLSFDSAMRLVEMVQTLPPDQVSAFQLIAIVQALPEADRMWTPVRKARNESVRVDQARYHYGVAVLGALQRWVPGEYAFWARCKRAAVLADWISGLSIQEIERIYSVPFGGQIQLGDIQRFADGTRFYLHSAHQVLSALLAMDQRREVEFEAIINQLEFGVPQELLPLMLSVPTLLRGECLALAAAGFATKESLLAADKKLLEGLLGARRAEQLIEPLAV